MIILHAKNVSRSRLVSFIERRLSLRFVRRTADIQQVLYFQPCSTAINLEATNVLITVLIRWFRSVIFQSCIQCAPTPVIVVIAP